MGRENSGEWSCINRLVISLKQEYLNWDLHELKGEAGWLQSPYSRDKLGIMRKKTEGLGQILALSYENTLTMTLEGLYLAAAVAAKSLQLCPILCDPIDSSPPDSVVPGILQARTLEWVAISFSNAWKWKVKVKSLSRLWFLATPWTAAYQAPPSMVFSRQEYWSGVPVPFPK